MRLAVPDLVSPSYFPAIAAVELGFLDARLELLSPVTRAYEALRDGRLDLVAGAAHAALYAFRDWRGGKLLCALAQGTYWCLVVKAEVGARRGDLDAVRGLRIGAAPGPADGLRRLLESAGIDAARDVTIGPVPGAVGEGVSFGVMAARALAAGAIDGFWANGMGAEVAVRSGTGTLVLDARREGSAEVRGYTFPALVTSQRLVDERPGAARAAVRAVVAAHAALRADPERATAVGRRLFPPAEAALIAELVRRDLPFYDTAISTDTLESMHRFARDLGLLSRPVSHEDAVWTG
jgi:ABC-type nitrate/sulfonate/bicarbonate transport system substrate-binding protein